MSFFYLLAQAVAAAQPEAAAAPQEGVISYPPSYFAAQQPSSALDMLNRIPGFQFDGGSGVRGFEGAAGNVLVDGQRPASKSDNLGDIIARIPASKVERIDIIRGGAPGIDMQGKTVLANVIRKQGGGMRALAEVRDLHTIDGRDLPGWRLEGSGDIGPRKWELAARMGSGFNDGSGPGHGVRIDGATGVRTDTVFETEGDGRQYVLQGAVETPVVGGALRLSARYLDDEFKGEEERDVLTTPPLHENNVNISTFRETEFGLRYGRAFGPATDIELVGLRTDRTRDFLNVFTSTSVSTFTQDRDISETIARGVLKHRFGADISAEFGAETAINKLDSVSAVTGTVVPGASVQVQEDRNEVFAKAAWRVTPKWTLDAGVRYEFSKLTSDGDVVLEKTLKYVKPRLTATWAPRSTTQIRLRVEREVGQLNFGDFVAQGDLNNAGGVTAGNPDLDPEDTWVGEATFEQRFWTKGAVVLTYRHSEIGDVVDRGPVFAPDGSVFDHPANIGDGVRDILQLSLTLPFDKVGLPGALLKSDIYRRWSHVIDPTTGERRALQGMHNYDWNLLFSYDLPQYKLTWGFDVFNPFRERYFRFNSIETFQLHAFIRTYVEWRPASDMSVRFDLNNVTRRDLRDTYLLYPGPRNASGPPSLDDRLTFKTLQSYAIRIRKNFGG